MGTNLNWFRWALVVLLPVVTHADPGGGGKGMPDWPEGYHDPELVKHRRLQHLKENGDPGEYEAALKAYDMEAKSQQRSRSPESKNGPELKARLLELERIQKINPSRSENLCNVYTSQGVKTEDLKTFIEQGITAQMDSIKKQLSEK